MASNIDNERKLFYELNEFTEEEIFKVEKCREEARKEVVDLVLEERRREKRKNKKEKRRVEKKYSVEDLEAAVVELNKRVAEKEAGRRKKVDVREISDLFNVPRSTLQDRRTKHVGKPIFPKG